MEKFLKMSRIKLKQKDFLNIFYQILIALEVAQEKIGFCHFDLHFENVMVINLPKPYIYKVISGK